LLIARCRCKCVSCSFGCPVGTRIELEFFRNLQNERKYKLTRNIIFKCKPDYYFVDMILEYKDFNFLIEVDEHSHASYPDENELNRLNNLIDLCKFRFNNFYVIRFSTNRSSVNDFVSIINKIIEKKDRYVYYVNYTEKLFTRRTKNVSMKCKLIKETF
jgi:hypothetical protein